ncbi:MAG: RNA-directed DNA polymerase [Lutisporaceae bacterium]|jgi:hypothetical protein
MFLTNSSIEFAINHILKYYDSDFFIKPFEFEAIKMFKNEVIKYLTSKEVDHFSVEPPKTFAVHKPKGGYRVVHQLDPLDSIIYTALTRDIAEKIETARCNISDSAVCSYRINIKNSNFFEDGNGYEDFNSKSDNLAKKYKFVLITDIVDFYNQIYLHRLRNSIEFVDASLEEISGVIENFLMKLNNKNSKGIPVGPSASIIMAEALLLDIDQFLVNKGFEYVRYVDDFRVFADNKIDLEWLLHDITDYIYENHRLTLSSSKTEIIDTTTFHKEYLFDADAIEKQRIHTELEKVQSVLSTPGCF